MSIDRKLIRRGVIVPTFKTKQNNDLGYTFGVISTILKLEQKPDH